jgi:RNA polymerase sigma-19 factor, ECF subfamily
MAKRSNKEGDDNIFSQFPDNPESAFEEFYLSYHATLTLFAYRITDNQGAAEDIAEEVFISLWNKWDTLSEIQSLKAYLYASVRNKCLTWLRKTKRESERYKIIGSTEEKTEEIILESMIYSETMSRIYAAMNKLPGQCKKVFILYYIEGKKVSEIAEELKISISSVRTHKGRSIELLKKGLGLFLWLVFSA